MTYHARPRMEDVTVGMAEEMLADEAGDARAVAQVRRDLLASGCPREDVNFFFPPADPDFAWLQEIVMADHADGEVVQVGSVAVVVRRRREPASG